MSHLPAERLAALASGPGGAGTPGAASGHFPEAPTPEEAAHLAACAECARERAAHRALLALAADERSRLAPPLTEWGALSAALRAEGLIGGAPATTADAARRGADGADGAVADLPAHRARWGAVRLATARRWGARAAAGVLLVLGGAVAGRATAPTIPGGADGDGSAVAPVGRGAVDGGDNLVRAVADTTPFRNSTEALVALARAEQDYQAAAAYLLDHDTTGRGAQRVQDSPSVYRARLAALDNMMTASREALYEAPHDPVINRYYLATLGAREATLRQLNTALPEGVRLTRF